ncbi:MAG: hypothetical protein H0T99_04385 [Geodermatophilaceae bacterium]|nr:hypothetical protein [Geodermatophilaceae bacterium]
MGSGVLLAILVGLWFVVLVPMVVTRGDLAHTSAEPTRVLRRRSDRSAMPSNATSRHNSAGSAAPSGQFAAGGRAARTAKAHELLTEPIPRLPKRVPGATMSTAASLGSERPVAQPVVEQPVADSPARDEADRREVGIRARRRRMLTGLIALAVLWAGFAAFWQPVLWWPQIILDLAIFSYLVFLRLEAQRDQDRQERRRARAAARVRLPEDRTERSIRRHTQYQAHVTAATEHQAIALDDDDPSFAQMPTWQPAAVPEPVVDDAAYWSARKAV